MKLIRACTLCGCWFDPSLISFTCFAAPFFIGKSTFAKMLSEAAISNEVKNSSLSRGVTNSQKMLSIIDTDKIGHDILLSPNLLSATELNGAQYSITARNSVYSKIVAEFGDWKVKNQNILDDHGEIDRRKLGDIIFQDPKKRRQLNRITHPRIIYVLLSQIVHDTFVSSKPVVIADVPLLFESGLLRALFGLTIVVATNSDIQLARLRKRNPDLSESQCRNRIASQMPIEQKIAKADIVVWNNLSYEELLTQLNVAWVTITDRLEQGRLSVFAYLLIISGYLLVSIFPTFTVTVK